MLSLAFQMGGAAVLGVGVWTLVEKSDYLSLLASSTFAVSAYILILAGSLVVVTGFLGCCAVIRERRRCLSVVRRQKGKAPLSSSNSKKKGFDTKKLKSLVICDVKSGSA